ncbi:MAG: response regulator [Bacteroidetes bacterium]|nr:response regulator [Bacteroidota bacterium]
MADLDGNILYQNNALNNLLEENETPVGESLLKNYSKENQELFSGIIKQLIETSHWKGEIEVLSKNGNAVLTLQTFFLIKDSNGNPSQIAAVITDITEQKKAEEELESFKMFADGSGEGFGMADLDSNILYMNRRLLELCELNEVSPEDSFLRFYTKDSIDAINNIVMPELKSKGQWQGELEFLTANNNLLITYHNFFLIKDENGQPYRMAALVMDMTDRKRSEEELRTFKRFAESSNEGIGIADMKSNILYMNKRLLEFAEIKNVSEHVSFFKYYQGKDREIITKLILPALNTKGQWQGEIDFTSVEGKLTPTYHNFFVINDENGKPYRIATIITDITQTKKIESELKKSKEQAEEANRLKSTFLSNMSHEIRTPMNAILGFSEILSKGLKDRSQLDYLSSIQSSGKTLLQLINDILDLSKIESGKLDFSYQPANIQNLIQETINMLKVKSDEKDLQINTVISKDLPGILNIDELRIKQVLINLISNAIKFTDKGYIEVEIGCLNKKKEHLDLFIKVEDTGIGISKTNHQKIFQAFDQIEGKDSKRFEGTGLGLAITRHLVTIMNGTIELESVIGKGSIFTIVLNKVKYNEADVEFEDSIDFDPDSLEFEESSVLIVDDIKTNRDVLIGYLSSYNIKIIEAENGKEALTAIEKYKPDLVFLDLRMPVMDGYEAHKTIMKNPKWSQIPIIAITASAFDKDERKIIALGFSGYIRKPASLNEILSCLMKHLKHTAEVKHEEIAAEVIFELIDKLDEVLLEIDKKAMPVWEGIMKIRKMKDVLLLSELIVEIGKKYNAESLIDYGNELHLATQSFNIDKELKLIQQFPDFVKKLNSSSNGR